MRRLRVRLGGAGSSDVIRVTQCEIVMGVDVGWGPLGLPSHYPGFIVPLLVRLWVGLQGRVRVCGRGDGWIGGAGVDVDGRICVDSIGRRSDCARGWGF